jgi:hypothetical protein
VFFVAITLRIFRGHEIFCRKISHKKHEKAQKTYERSTVIRYFFTESFAALKCTSKPVSFDRFFLLFLFSCIFVYFVVMTLTDFCEAHARTSWLIWTTLANLADWLKLRAIVFRTLSP